MALSEKMYKCRVLNTQLLDLKKCLNCTIFRFCVQATETAEPKFKIIKIRPAKAKPRVKEVREKCISPPRTEKMSVNQKWNNVWPGPRSFHPASVPFSLFQGNSYDSLPPGKFCNLELMKIPNFLHLTPPAIKIHCTALKKFCTKWPEELNTEKKMEKHFPIEIIYSDYCHSGPVIRNPLSRIVSLRFKLKSLNFDQHSEDKFMRLVGKRYCPATNYVTITTENCPLKKQNYDYAHYLLTALYFESWKFEDWEKNKQDDDMQDYLFQERNSFKSCKSLFAYNNRTLPNLTNFGNAVTNWQMKGDDPNIIRNYKTEVCKLLELPPLHSKKK